MSGYGRLALLHVSTSQTSAWGSADRASTVTNWRAGSHPPVSGPGAGVVVLTQTRQHDAAVLGRRPVLVLVDDQGDGVDAIGSRDRGTGLRGPQIGPVAALRKPCPPGRAHLDRRQARGGRGGRQDLVGPGCGERCQAEVIGAGADLCPALYTGLAAAGDGRCPACAGGGCACPRSTGPVRGAGVRHGRSPWRHMQLAEFSRAPRSNVQGLVGSTSPASVRRRKASAWAKPAL